jgi:predicted CoA-substrate-specific enzyme activase
VEIGRNESNEAGSYQGRDRLRWWIEEGQHEQKKKEGRKGLWSTPEEFEEFNRRYGQTAKADSKHDRRSAPTSDLTPCVIGCDFGSTTAKAACLSPQNEVLFTCYALSKGNPIEDAKSLFRQIRDAGVGKLLGVGITGYGAALLQDVIGADISIVETVAHAAAALHFFPDADCICDVGGVDVKIMLIKHRTVSDFRLNSQCSSGNGAFLQGVAERFDIPLTEIADRAFEAKAMPRMTMGCGVFLQSDIVNHQRKGWQADEILAGLCATLPLNAWVYAGGLNNLAAVGKKFILQGGTHKNLAVVKAQVDFIRNKIPDAEIVVHPYSGEAGAIGAALCTLHCWEQGERTQFRGFDVIKDLTYRTTTSLETVCQWCPVNCQRTFVDAEIPGAKGRSWSKVPLQQGWERVITNNSCPKGLVEDVNELKAVKAEMDRVKDAYPNIGEMVHKEAFRTSAL